jgi:hypothetical protein
MGKQGNDPVFPFLTLAPKLKLFYKQFSIGGSPEAKILTCISPKREKQG